MFRMFQNQPSEEYTENIRNAPPPTQGQPNHALSGDVSPPRISPPTIISLFFIPTISQPSFLHAAGADKVDQCDVFPRVFF